MSDHPAKKFDREWLDEATYRTLGHYAMILHLDPDLYQPGDHFPEWAKRCGVTVSVMEEGGAVAKRLEDGASYFITPEQYTALVAELAALSPGEES